MRELVLGSRGSRLALWQSRHLQTRVEGLHPGLQVRLEVIQTSGDKMKEVALAGAGTKGVFVKEIEEALLDGRIDLAVHSLKDVPTELPAGLELGVILAREDPRDALVGRREIDSLEDLSAGSRLGTGSLRRSVQLWHLRSDLCIEPLRGNVDTRLRKMRDNNLDGVILAAAGLKRLGLGRQISYLFPIREMIPAVGQGALSVEIRRHDGRVRRLLEPLEDSDTRACVEAERVFLSRMGGGCQVPMAAHARFHDGEALFSAIVAGPSSHRLVRENYRGSREELADLCLHAVQSLLANGAEEMLQELG
ncbi:MAG: hydroxymethylbilane synthase [Acidobacteriota bacterium]